MNGTKADTQFYRCQEAGGVRGGGGWGEVGGALATHMGFPECSDVTSEENGTKADTQLYRCQGAGHRPGGRTVPDGQAPSDCGRSQPRNRLPF